MTTAFTHLAQSALELLVLFDGLGLLQQIGFGYVRRHPVGILKGPITFVVPVIRGRGRGRNLTFLIDRVSFRDEGIFHARDLLP